MRLTNRNGELDTPIAIQVPAISAGQSPGTGTVPYTSIGLFARAGNYEGIEAENIQIFPGIVTVQNLELIPLSEFPDSFNKLERFDTPPQNL